MAAENGGQTNDAKAIAEMVKRANAQVIRANAQVIKANAAVKEFQAANPDVDIEALLAEHEEFRSMLAEGRSGELGRFIGHAIEMGTEMSFAEMEEGVLDAGYADMRNGLARVMDSLKFEAPVCQEDGTPMENRGRGKKKVLTAVGPVEVHPTRYACGVCQGESAYPLIDYVGLVEVDEAKDDGTVETKTIKCTPGASECIGLFTGEVTFVTAVAIINKLAKWGLDDMTAFRVTESVSSEFVQEVPTGIGKDRIREIAEKMDCGILKERINQLETSDNKEAIIKNALLNGPEGIPLKDYVGPVFSVMYVLLDGTGVPGRKAELEGVKGRQADGSAKTFEAKIGAVVIVEYAADGRPLLTVNGEIYRNCPTQYTGTVRRAKDFGLMLYQHALDNGLADVDSVVVLGDGARWIWRIQQKFFPNALTGLDLYHSMEHLTTLIDHIQFRSRLVTEKKDDVREQCDSLLRQGRVGEMIAVLETMPCKKGHEKAFKAGVNYFRDNMDRMNYGVFTALGIYVGSGVIEAGVKMIVGNRMKQAGMHWSKHHAERMIVLRCAIKNGKYSDVYRANHNQTQRAA